MCKDLINPGDYSHNINYVLLILRLSVGVFMLSHGWGKFLMLIGDDPIQFADPLGVGITASLALTVFAEVFCSVLLIFGLATRLAGVSLFITMLVAAFIVHANDGFVKMELALIYGIIYLVIIIAGAGKISIDNWKYRKLKLK